MLVLGEHWLRMKLKFHTKETFHRADEQLVYLAVQDTLRELDRCRAEIDDLKDEIREIGELCDG